MPVAVSVTPFAEWLAAELNERRWNHSQLAAAMDRRQQTVSSWFNDARIPSPALCRVLATTLRLPPELVLEKAGHLANADYEEPELPAWLTSVLERLDPYELRVMERTAQGLLSLREERGAYEANPPSAPGSPPHA